MITADQLKVGMRVKYFEGEESVVATVVKVDNQAGEVHFIDKDDFEWAEKFSDIPNTVKRILQNP